LIETIDLTTVDDSLLSEINKKVTATTAMMNKLRTQMESKVTTDKISSQLFPSIRYTQDRNQITLIVKLSTKFSAPGIIKAENVEHSLDENNILTFSAEG